VNLPAGGSVTYTASCTISASATGTLSNTATVAAPGGVTDPTPGNNSATDSDTLSPEADLSVTKTDSPDPVPVGTNLTYTITVTNAGPSDAAGASLSDSLPAGTTFVSLSSPAGWSCTTPAVGAGGTVSCSNPSFAVGSAVFTLTVAVDPGTTVGTVITNTATASSATTDPNPGNESATASTTVAASADLSVTKMDTPDPTLPGGTITYDITVTNAGPNDAASVTLSDPLPAGTTFAALTADPAWSCSTPAVGAGGTVSCTLSSLAAMDSASISLTVAVDAGVTPGTIITNTATVSSTTSDPNPGNENATASTTVGTPPPTSDLSVTKVDNPDPVTPGSNLVYTITVNNAGPSAAAPAGLDDDLPLEVTFVSLSSPGGWSCTTPAVGSGGTVSCSNPSFAPGSAVFTLTVQVDPSVTPGTTIFNSATVSTPNDTDESNDVGSAMTAVVSPVSVSGTKTVSGTFTPGGTVTYTVVLTNSGPSAQMDNPGNEFTDVLPSSLTLVSAMATSGTAVATVATNTVTWNGSIASGGSVTITITATINSIVPPGTTISNQGNISFDADANGTNESSAVTDNPATGAPGDATSFQVAQQGAEIPTLDELGLVLLAALLALGGAGVLRRRRSA